MKSNIDKCNDFETNPCILAKYFFLNYLDFVNILVFLLQKILLALKTLRPQ